MYKELLAENQLYGSLSYKEEENDNDDVNNEEKNLWEKNY